MQLSECLDWFKKQDEDLREVLVEQANAYAEDFVDKFMHPPPDLSSETREIHDELLRRIGTWSPNEMTPEQIDDLITRVHVGALMLAVRVYLGLKTVQDPGDQSS